MFSDQHFETAGILGEVLDILINAKSCMGLKHSNFPSLMCFLRKYDMQPVITLVKLQLESSLYNRVSMFDAFIKAAVMNDIELCSKAIATIGGTISWPETASNGWAGAVPKSLALDPRATPYYYLEMIPTPLMFALLRSSLAATKDGRIDAKVMSESFVRLMRLRSEDVSVSPRVHS